MKITKEQIENWVGGDSTVDACLSVLAELVNGEYSISEMRNHIINYYDEEEMPPQEDKRFLSDGSPNIY